MMRDEDLGTTVGAMLAQLAVLQAVGARARDEADAELTRKAARLTRMIMVLPELVRRFAETGSTSPGHDAIPAERGDDPDPGGREADLRAAAEWLIDEGEER